MAGLECSQLLEFRRVIAKLTVEIIGKNIEVAIRVHEPAVHTTVVPVADAVQGCRVDHWQGRKENGMDKSEDCRVCANAERNRQDDSSRKSGKLSQLTESEFEVLHNIQVFSAN